MYEVILKLDKFFLKYEGGDVGGGGRGGGCQIDLPLGKTTFKKPSLIRVKYGTLLKINSAIYSLMKICKKFSEQTFNWPELHTKRDN